MSTGNVLRRTTMGLIWLTAGAAAFGQAGARPTAPPREELFRNVEGLTRHFDVVYGQDDPAYQQLDAYIVRSDEPSPVLMRYHAGGYIGGNKSEFIGRTAGKYEAFLNAGISVVSCHYRLAPKYEFPAPLLDTARSIQFVRSKAKEWNIDPNRIACVGGSAGGHLATWIALAPDLATPASDDPIARQSSRVSCFIGCGPL
ncbi:MAG: alpha/beta hydrolase, partial [Armatimonadota bacterium]